MADILFNKRDYIVLEILIERNCTTPVASLTIKQLIKLTNMSSSKVRSVKDNFLMMELIAEGSKDDNKTFYITDKGIEHYKLAFGFDDAKINEIVNDFEKKYNETNKEVK